MRSKYFIKQMQSGYFLLNKPEEISSFFILKKLQWKFRDEFGQKKVKLGHAGTLDPLAQGLLLCGIGKGTKVLSEIILAKKSYTAEIFLGKFSTTDDREGEKFSPEHKPVITSDSVAISSDSQPPSLEEIEKVLQKFIGKIQQIPPKYSALKIQGKRACDRVRDGQEIEMKSREIEIFQIKILEYNFPIVKIFVECGSGTYIRSLARDIGTQLGIGGYLHFLRRESVGDFLLSDSVTLENFSLESIKKFTPENFSLPITYLTTAEEIRVRKGQRINFFDTDAKALEDMPLSNQKKSEKIVLFGKDSRECIGFAEQDGRILRPRKLL